VTPISTGRGKRTVNDEGSPAAISLSLKGCTVKKLSIYLHKRRLRIAYQRYIRERVDMDCGISLAETISPHLVHLRDRCNHLLDQLAKLDPDNCPITRIN